MSSSGSASGIFQLCAVLDEFGTLDSKVVGVHIWDVSGFGFFVGLKHFSDCAVSEKISLLKLISEPESQSAFSCWFSSSGRSCFLSLCNLSLSLFF